MKLGLRLLLGFFLITGIAAFFVLRVFATEVKPSVREVMEDTLVDTANILAELARDELVAMPAGGTLEDSHFARAVKDYAARPIDVQIWGLSKQSLDYRIYLTDATGRVVFDSGLPGQPSAVGHDFSQWRDVARTLTGNYGARSTRDDDGDDKSTVMYVAAPVRQGDRIIGVLTVAKPNLTVQKFVDRAVSKILVRGAWLLAISVVVGVLVTGWVVWSVRRLRQYAQEVQVGERREVPRLSGELGDLAVAIASMRERLEGREHLENTVRALTHELKSPMAAIAGAAELLQDELPPADRDLFARQIQEQVDRLRALVDRMLELSKLEHRRTLDHPLRLELADCVDAVLARSAARLQQRRMQVRWLHRDRVQIDGEREVLERAIANLVDNAIDFAPLDSMLDLELRHAEHEATLVVRDHGVGVEAYALERLGERFFSTPRPADNPTAIKGSGLGIAIVREIVALHGGRLAIANADPGLRVTITLPARRGTADLPDFTLASHTSSRAHAR
ncbi:two-component system sensor histidine kinase CreC [soil metagenome]